MLQKDIYKNIFPCLVVKESVNLQGVEKVWAQIAHNIWEWMKDGHSSSSYFSTKIADYNIADIIKYNVESRELAAQNRIFAIWGAIKYLKEKLEEYDKEKLAMAKSRPEVQKAMSEVTSKFDIFNSTKIGSVIADEIIEYLKNK